MLEFVTVRRLVRSLIELFREKIIDVALTVVEGLVIRDEF